MPAGLLVTAALFIVAACGTAKQDPRTSSAEDTTFVAPEIADTAALLGPRQPIFFRHDIHAGQYRMDCQYCHVNVEVSVKPGIPSLASCMNCHLIVGSGIAEVDSVRAYFNEGRKIEWVEVHVLSQFVHFPHHIHVNAEEEFEMVCEDCHGQVDRMPQIYQFAPLKMGWCLDCHIQKTEDIGTPVSTDCSVCHY
jgi:hypothetical protein